MRRKALVGGSPLCCTLLSRRTGAHGLATIPAAIAAEVAVRGVGCVELPKAVKEALQEAQRSGAVWLVLLPGIASFCVRMHRHVCVCVQHLTHLMRSSKQCMWII